MPKEHGVPLLMGGLSHQLFSNIKASGLGKKDWSVTMKMFEDLLKIKVEILENDYTDSSMSREGEARWRNG